MGTRALVCVKVEEKWYVTHQAFNGMKREVDYDGPEYKEWLEATYFEVEGVPSHLEYSSLRRALETELPKDHYEYLHIWQQGKWSTTCMN